MQISEDVIHLGLQPVVSNDPPPPPILFIRNFLGVPPLYPKLIEMTPPLSPQKKKTLLKTSCLAKVNTVHSTRQTLLEINNTHIRHQIHYTTIIATLYNR